MAINNKYLLVAFISFSAILVIMFLFKNTQIVASLNQNHGSNGRANMFENFVNKAVNAFTQKENASLLNSDMVGNSETIFEMIKKMPNDVVLKYVNLPYDYKYGSNSIPLAICALISNGDFLELGMVILLKN